MTLSDNAMTLSEAIEQFGPMDDDEIVVTLLRWDEWADPLSDDLVRPIAGWSEYDAVSLHPPKKGVTWHYVDSEGNQYTTEEMLDGESEWFDPPQELPDRSES